LVRFPITSTSAAWTSYTPHISIAVVCVGIAVVGMR
jgi:hypothetical protein